MTAHGDTSQLYRDLCLIDSSGWATEQAERNLKNKISRTLARLKGNEIKRIIAMSDASFAELMSRPLSSPLPVPAALMKPCRCAVIPKKASLTRGLWAEQGAAPGARTPRRAVKA